MAKSRKNIVEIGVISVALPKGLKALPTGFKKTFAAKCKELNYTMKTQLAEIAANGGNVTGTTTRGRKASKG